jgi:DNA-binding HxlR family transcriptional regulator
VRRTYFWILPVEVFGRLPNTTVRGHLKWARLERQWLISSSAVAAAPGFSATKAQGVSPQCSSACATTAASSTAGWALYLQLRACSVARALVIIGDRWSFQILRAAFFGVRRFEDFARLLNLARNVLTSRLGKLTAEGVFERRQYEARPPRFEYVLTKKGLAFYDSCLLLIQWGDEWIADSHGVPLHLRHRLCGEVFKAELVCGHCAEPVLAQEVEFQDGPGVRLL